MTMREWVATEGRLAFAETLDHLHQAVQHVRERGGDQAVTEWLAKHAAGDNVLFRYAIARYRQCPPDVLVTLLADDDEDVRQEALANPNLPEEYRVLGLVAE